MSPEKVGALVARAAGVVLIVVGLSPLLSWLPYGNPGGATAGWTSYSPLGASPGAVTGGVNPIEQLSGAFVTSYSSTRCNLPYLAQAAAGAAMIVFSRRMGKCLAKGLDDENERKD